MPKPNRDMTDVTIIGLPGGRSAIPDEFTQEPLSLEPKSHLWAGRIRDSLSCGRALVAFAHSRVQGHVPARALPARAGGAAAS